MRLELGCGNKPAPGFIHHDRWKHSPHVELDFDLEQIPWPLAAGEVEELRAFDVFEHLHLEVQQWLDECWRVLALRGVLDMRLPSWDNHYSYRDPTHRRVFHSESFLYWCPEAPGTVWTDFGRYYFGPDYNRWWKQMEVIRSAGDWRYKLMKIEWKP